MRVRKKSILKKGLIVGLHLTFSVIFLRIWPEYDILFVLIPVLTDTFVIYKNKN